MSQPDTKLSFVVYPLSEIFDDAQAMLENAEAAKARADEMQRDKGWAQGGGDGMYAGDLKEIVTLFQQFQDRGETHVALGQPLYGSIPPNAMGILVGEYRCGRMSPFDVAQMPPFR